MRITVCIHLHIDKENNSYTWCLTFREGHNLTVFAKKYWREYVDLKGGSEKRIRKAA
jgi:hypothetical protein